MYNSYITENKLNTLILSSMLIKSPSPVIKTCKAKSLLYWQMKEHLNITKEGRSSDCLVKIPDPRGKKLGRRLTTHLWDRLNKQLEREDSELLTLFPKVSDENCYIYFACQLQK